MQDLISISDVFHDYFEKFEFTYA